MHNITYADMKIKFTLFIHLILAQFVFSFNQINYFDPVPNAKYVNVNTSIIIGFKTRLLLTEEEILNSITVTGSRSGLHKGKVTLLENGQKVLFQPNSPFEFNESVEIIISGNKIDTYTGAGGYASRFTTSVRKVDINPEKYTDDGIYKTGERSFLPPPLNVTVNNNPSAGYLFTCPWNTFSSLVILNKDGTEYWSTLSYNLLGDFKKQPNGNYTYFSSTGNGIHYALDRDYKIVDYYKCGNGYSTDIHELKVLENGHAYVMAYDPQLVNMSEIVIGGDSNATVVGLIIQEIDVNKNVVFQWRSWDHFEITDATHENFLDSVIDYVHGNAIEIDYDNNILISSRHLDEITKIDRSTGAIIWRFGGKNNEFTFSNDPVGFSHQHDVRRLQNGNISLFDNGNYHSPNYSRILEYTLDEVTKTATLSWSYRHSPDIFAPWGGNAQRLLNGNTLIGWGGASVSISEVTPSGNIVFEGSFPASIYSYRSYKFDLSPTQIVHNGQNIPEELTLEQNYPDPFNPVTNLVFKIAHKGFVNLSVYDGLGRKVETMLNAELTPGTYKAVWDGSRFASGVYYYRIQENESVSGETFTKVKKMVLLK